MRNRRRETGGIEPLGVRSVGEVQRLTRNQIGALPGGPYELL
jgi:hypothetical protein